MRQALDGDDHGGLAEYAEAGSIRSGLEKGYRNSRGHVLLV